ncbi:hypothetical protein BCF46_1396 [Litoreibacter meonggei]|uniref:Uncharacterized protein n=1 Tax=Litoreibacter meonggei TaxID=1049199 RepID=A0A497WYE5_9RHOB|nr:hypothetical protein [Litoreibacter meonggei]RLJ59248.1 hypothetical protein BCF46_1396 [Litoreibacter meonggei]
MTKQLLVWTVLPYGRVTEGDHRGKWRVSIVVSPRLTPEAADEQQLGAFGEWLSWPDTLTQASFGLRVGARTGALTVISKPDPNIWSRFFTDQTPVAGFVYKDMSKVNLHSYAVRNVLAFARTNYANLAVQSGDEHPKLLPWKEADTGLRGMLSDIGTATDKFTVSDREIEVMRPGFSRFHDDERRLSIERSVFGDKSVYEMDVVAPGVERDGVAPSTVARAPLRAMPPDWNDPAGGGPDAALMGQFNSEDEYTFYQADRFYRRKQASKAEKKKLRPDFKDIRPSPKAPDYDFHRIVASLGDYGALMRQLGLVIDCVIEDDALIEDMIAPGSGNGVGQMQLQIKWRGAAPGDDATPRTAWYAEQDRFVPQPRTMEHAAGMLRLEESDDGWHLAKQKDGGGLFDMYQVDPDGAALKTVNYTLTAQNLVGKSLSLMQEHGEVTYTTPDRQPVAALRSCGIGVSQHGRAQELAKLAAAADLKNTEIVNGNAENVVLFAEDIHRGYRVDIADVPDQIQPGKWQTLCARDGDYRLIETDEALKFEADEGYVSGSSLAGDPDDADTHYMHESLFRWNGWSLVAPRPGKTIKSETNEDNNLQAEGPADVTDTAENGNGLAVTFRAVKGSLPRLRFGHFFRVRARIVDLAGNSLALDDASIEPLEHASEPVGYWRFEPVDPPAVLQRERLSEGEQLERMVIRSNFKLKSADYLQTPDFVAASNEDASQDFAYTEVNERHFVPPKSSQQQCETHGLFDPFFGGDWADAKKAYEIAAREAGSLYDHVPGSQIKLITPTAVKDAATTSIVPPELPSETNPVGDRMVGGQYIIHAEAHVATPYLPDGAAGGVAIRAVRGHKLPGALPGMILGDHCRVVELDDELVLMVRHGDEWPHSKGFRLILAERDETNIDLPCNVSFDDGGEPEWDEGRRELTLFLPKGQILHLRYASFVHPEFAHHFGIPRWSNSAMAADAVMKSSTVGAHWMITPYRGLTLVHATQQPVCLPNMTKMTPQRGKGDQNVRLSCREVELHGPSTGKFEVEATWREWVDDINSDRPERVEFKGQLGEVRLADNHINRFPLSTAVDDQLADPEAVRGDIHELGDTRFRLIEYRIRATTRFREYLPPAMYDKTELISRLGPVAIGEKFALPAEDDPGAPVLRDANGSRKQSLVKSSAAPREPRLLYVLPTFRWTRNNTSTKHDATRVGNGLRIWLDRPWFSSGDGELLGIILHKEGGNLANIPEDMEQLVTQWGTDPLWETATPKKSIRESDFGASVVSEDVKLQEKPDAPKVRIVGHRVHWDDDRKLWYCDVELNPGATYMPFVRLALVRYQPNSIGGTKISKVVLAEFAQVLPRRRIVATPKNATLKVALHGPNPIRGPIEFTRDSSFQNVSFVNGPFETGRNRVEIVLQQRDDGIDSDLGWKDVKVLHQHVVGEDPDDDDGPTIRPVARDPGRVVLRRSGGSIRLPNMVNRGNTPTLRTTSNLTRAGAAAVNSLVKRGTGLTVGDIGALDPFVTDPSFWDADVKIPSGSGARRIVVREFERYYSDNTASEQVGTTTFPRRIIEERLVFADTVTID